jgi:flavin-dependent dehydrogenase
VRRYPFLATHGGPFTRVREAELVAGNGEWVRFPLRAPLLVYSRAVLNNLLLHRAQAAGADVIHDRILGFERDGSAWRLHGRSRTYCVDYLILAAGARTTLRPLLALPWRASDFMLTFGYYTDAGDSVLRVQFFDAFEGYAWAFPRPDHLSLGICAKFGEEPMPELRNRLQEFMRRFDYPMTPAPVFSHLLPALDQTTWNGISLAGPGWALAGDAAGLVDPLTGEGIYFAMRSGELVGEAWRNGSLNFYHQKLWSEFGGRLAMGARLAPRFYHGKFLGKPSTTRLVEFCSRSPAFMDLLQDLFEGAQTYSSLPARVYRTFGRGLFQMAARRILNYEW